MDEIAKGKNTRLIACNSLDVSTVTQSRNLTSVKVFADVASDGMMMPPHFI